MCAKTTGIQYALDALPYPPAILTAIADAAAKALTIKQA